MDTRRNHYSRLFNLEPLMKFQLPRLGQDLDNYDNSSSQDDSRGSQGQRELLKDCNGTSIRGPSTSTKRQKEHDMLDADSNSEEYREHDSKITEDHYRSMLGDHIQKYRKASVFKESSVGSAPIRMAVPVSNRSRAMKGGKYHTEPLHIKDEVVINKKEISPGYHDVDVGWEYDNSIIPASLLESAYLDMGDEIKYRIPQTYDKLVTTLNLPSYSDICIEEHILTSSLDMHTLALLLSSERRFGFGNGGGLAEPQPQYESLQARLKAASCGNSNKNFILEVSDAVLSSFSIPEGAAGRIRRSIMSESGVLQVYYVKVLEKGDTYEIIERSLPRKQIVKKDPSVIEKEEIDKMGRVWLSIARRDILKHHKVFTNFHRKQLTDAKRSAESCQREVKIKISRSLKYMKNAVFRTRKLARDMLIFWKRMDKEQAELRKKEERDAAEALKREEELREAKRQQQRLNFLISQTELYSHFMQNKPASQPSEEVTDVDGVSQVPGESSVADDKQEEDEDPEEAELKKEALRAAHLAVSQQKKITDEFDNECLKFRQDDASNQINDPSIAGSSDIDLLNPSTMPVKSSVQTPAMFKGSLKEYQLKGLQWLVNCYEQGLNGILADEMGLGKTIQAMAFLAHLAEEKNIWGPFLVVAPSSVMNNWADEISRFCPDLKTLPYWGEQSVRKILQKNINPKRLYRRESGFHILVTSYQLLIVDEKILRKVKWQYMVLDEAQAIKSSSSIRWKTLLGFNCRNRLLLTGTPIQNNMAELWALLHFIMPTLFDSHDQFNEWFSKGIESHAERGDSVNEHQLNRLHAVLKPFMLRRVKKDVITEISAKNEVTVHCKLSSRQQAFYQAIKNKISLAELCDSSRGHLTDNKMKNLLNIVIQLRKVCNHPELFERNEGRSYFFFGEIPNALLPPPFGEMEDVPYSGDRNPITYKLPKLIYQEVVRCSEMPCSVVGHGLKYGSFEKLFNVFTPENVYMTMLGTECLHDAFNGNKTFGFSRLINLSPSDLSLLANGSIFERVLHSVSRRNVHSVDEMLGFFMDLEGEELVTGNLDEGKVRAVARMLMLPTKSESSFLRKRLPTGLDDCPFEALVMSNEDRFMSNIKLLRSTYAFIPPARAPPISIQCSDRRFSYQLAEELNHPWVKRLLVGFARTSEFNGPRKPQVPHYLIQEIDAELPVVQPILKFMYRIFGSSPPVQSFEPAKMLTESGKLQTLDILLKRLRSENHRILLFAQMTKMLDILEDYMNYRKYRYFRLDGSSSIMDRRDMVRDFQDRNDVFVFLLSTRAGGLGINLTAADTVIFYESDWNPTLDLQAMDRAHRLGQTKEVTVYRLICKETIEEKILRRASQKNTVQQLVMTGRHVQGGDMPHEDVVSLLLEDEQLEQKLREVPQQVKDRQKKKQVNKGIRVDQEGDATFEVFTNGSHFPENVASGAEHKKGAKKRKPSSYNQKQHIQIISKPVVRNGMLEETSYNQKRYSQFASKHDVQDGMLEVNLEVGLSEINEDESNLDLAPRRSKRQKKSVNGNLMPVSDTAPDAEEQQQYGYDYRAGGYEGGMLQSRTGVDSPAM